MLQLIKSHVAGSVAVYGGAVLVMLGAVWLAYQYVDPPPPDTAVIASGSETGAYHGFAKEYESVFAEQGIALTVLQTNGSMDNLARLAAPGDEQTDRVDAAFIQGGVATPDDHPDLESLGSLYFEPLWVFHRKGVEVERLSDLKGLRAAVGAEGSGTKFLVDTLLNDNGVDSSNAELLAMGSGEAVPALLAGEVDAVFLIAGAASDNVKTLLRADDVRIMSFDRAEAYARSHRYLQKLVLPRGGVSLADDLPAEDVQLLAPTANLVVRADLHPAVKFLFLLAASELHQEGDVFASPDQFPNRHNTIFPLSPEAESFHDGGPPFLMKYLPYRAAVSAERLKILLIPLLTLLFPLFKITPPLYRWQIQRRIFKWYKRLRKLDALAFDVDDPAEIRAMLDELEDLDRKVMKTSVPVSYADATYSLRIHIKLIRERLQAMVDATGDEGPDTEETA